MKKVLALLALVAVSVLALAPRALAQDTVTLSASLSGANEVDDSGDPDGSGNASVTVDAENTQLCFDISVSGIEDVMAGHIHSGGAGSNGDVVVDFALDATKTTGCVEISEALTASILNTPQLFYGNVHNDAFPAGAIRGQLEAPVAAASDEAPAAETTADDAATTTTGGETLAFTGDVTGALAVFGAALIMSGITAVVASRRQG